MTIPLNYSFVGETSLRHTYPYGRFDIDLAMGTAEQLQTSIPEIYQVVPECRRIIVAVEQSDIKGIKTCEDAGLRYSLDVETRDGREVSLMVHEPDWVANQSTEIEDLELS